MKIAMCNERLRSVAVPDRSGATRASPVIKQRSPDVSPEAENTPSGDGGGVAAAYAEEGCSRPGTKIKVVVHFSLSVGLILVPGPT